jgi:hypothetical protein
MPVVSDGLVRSADSYKPKDVAYRIVLNSRAQNLISAWSSNCDSLKRRILKTTNVSELNTTDCDALDALHVG